MRVLPRFVDHAVGAGAGGMNESDLPAAGNDEKSNVAIEPNNINTGSGEKDLLEEGVVVHSDSDSHFFRREKRP